MKGGQCNVKGHYGCAPPIVSLADLDRSTRRSWPSCVDHTTTNHCCNANAVLGNCRNLQPWTQPLSTLCWETRVRTIGACYNGQRICGEREQNIWRTKIVLHHCWASIMSTVTIYIRGQKSFKMKRQRDMQPRKKVVIANHCFSQIMSQDNVNYNAQWGI